MLLQTIRQNIAANAANHIKKGELEPVGILLYHLNRSYTPEYKDLTDEEIVQTIKSNNTKEIKQCRSIIRNTSDDFTRELTMHYLKVVLKVRKLVIKYCFTKT